MVDKTCGHNSSEGESLICQGQRSLSCEYCEACGRVFKIWTYDPGNHEVMEWMLKSKKPCDDFDEYEEFNEVCHDKTIMPTSSFTKEQLEEIRRMTHESLAKQYILNNWDKFVSVECSSGGDHEDIAIKEINDEIVKLVIRGVERCDGV